VGCTRWIWIRLIRIRIRIRLVRIRLVWGRFLVFLRSSLSAELLPLSRFVTQSYSRFSLARSIPSPSFRCFPTSSPLHLLTSSLPLSVTPSLRRSLARTASLPVSLAAPRVALLPYSLSRSVPPRSARWRRSHLSYRINIWTRQAPDSALPEADPLMNRILTIGKHFKVDVLGYKLDQKLVTGGFQTEVSFESHKDSEKKGKKNVIVV
jgi:hypothetical protein